MRLTFFSFVFWGACISCFCSPISRADDVLSPATLQTPFGPMAYVLPEGYCLMDGRDGRVMSGALDRSEGVPPHSVGERFLPCSDRRSLYESHNWPLEHGDIRLTFLADNFSNGPDNVLWDIEYRMRQASLGDILSQDILGNALSEKPDMHIPGRDDMVDDVRSVVRAHWLGVWSDIGRDALNHQRGGFPVGRMQDIVWWAGFDHETNHQILARVTATFIWQGFRVDMSMERPFRGVDTFDGLMGDLQPAVEASIVLNGPLYWVPSKKRLALDAVDSGPDSTPLNKDKVEAKEH